MFYPFGTAILVDLLLTSIIFPRIQTFIAESVKDSDRRGIILHLEGESWKSWQLLIYHHPSILGCMQSSLRMETDRKSMRKRDMLTIWLRISANGVKIFLRYTNWGRKWKYFATSSEGLQLCHVDSHMWFVGHNMFYLTQVCLRLHIIYRLRLTHWTDVPVQ